MVWLCGVVGWSGYMEDVDEIINVRLALLKEKTLSRLGKLH